MERRVTAQEVIREIAYNMEEGLEPLEYSVLAPDHFDVYLEAEDHRLLEPLFDEIGRQARRKLDERLEALNAEAAQPRRLRLPWQSESPPVQYERRAARWEIAFCVDHEPDAERGRITVHSYFSAAGDGAGGPSALAGARTKRLAPRGAEHEAGSTTRVLAPPAASATVLAHLRYEDLDGPHVYAMTKDAIVIGRADAASSGYWVDLPLRVPADVSREHARLRRDAATGRFFIKDLSRFGTLVDGEPVPPSLERSGDGEEDRDLWIPLPSQGEIDLAGVVTLRFEAA